MHYGARDRFLWLIWVTAEVAGPLWFTTAVIDQCTVGIVDRDSLRRLNVGGRQALRQAQQGCVSHAAAPMARISWQSRPAIISW